MIQGIIVISKGGPYYVHDLIESVDQLYVFFFWKGSNFNIRTRLFFFLKKKNLKYDSLIKLKGNTRFRTFSIKNIPY